mgnify:FL=1|jgi:hypothetical protein
MCLPFAMEGANIMQTVKFVTVEKDKVMVWCTTNSIIVFRDFMQYVLDTMNNPEDFMIIDTRNDLVYGMRCIATKQYKMRKRTFEERMNDVQTGKWSKFSDIELKGM